MSLSPWLMKACLTVGMRSTCEVLPEFAGCSSTGSVECSRRIRWATFGMQRIGDVGGLDLPHHEPLAQHDERAVPPAARASAATCSPGTRRRCRRRSTCPTVGLYAASQPSSQASASSSPAGRSCRAAAGRPGARPRVSSTAQHTKRRHSAPAGVPRHRSECRTGRDERGAAEQPCGPACCRRARAARGRGGARRRRCCA